jgi:signal transduction histidine kinase
LQITLSLSEEYEVCEEYFQITRGLLEAAPGLIGYPASVVEMRRSGHTTVYEIDLPPKRRWRDSIRRFFRNLRLNRAVAAAEVEKSLQMLELEHHELQAANRIVERQAKQIQTVDELGRSLVNDVEPEKIVGAMRSLLQERVGFQAVAYYAVAAERRSLRQAISTFDDNLPQEVELDALEALRAELGARWPLLRQAPLRTQEGQFIGLLLCLPREEGSADLVLFDALLPHLTIAAKHSLAYRTIQELNRGLERRVELRTAELSRAKGELTVTVKQLEDAMGAKDRLFANLNHEFRTPITLMLLPLERMLELPELEGFRPRLLAMEVNAHKLLRLVDGILDLAASQEGRLRLKLERVDVTEIAREAVQAYAPAAQELKLGLTLDAAQPALVFGSSEGIGRIVDNLLSNALKYTPAGGDIRMRVQNRGDAVQLSVHDTGIGIKPEDRERIFERFERAGEPVAPGATSTGIGLALVKELCAWHGGAVAVSSEPGQGSTFEVTLPCLPTDAVRAREARRKASETHAEEPRRESERLAKLKPQMAGLALPGASVPATTAAAPSTAATILVVEDHPDLRTQIADVLGPSFRVLTAENGQQALDLLAKQPVDLVLSDLVMPGMDGLELCKRLKANPAFGLVPFILVTALHDRAFLNRSLDLGADDFIVKPFNEGELLARVRAQLRIRELAKKLAESSRLAATGTILSGMAHELRNPVNVLVNGIAPLRESVQELLSKDPGVGQLLDALEDSGRRVSELTDELLAFRRPYAEKGEHVGVRDLIGQSLALLKPKLSRMTVETDIGIEGDVRGSAHSLSQVVVNLVENAIHAVNGTGHVGIQAREAPEGVWVEVWDDGPGVAVENRGKLFEPFFSTKRAGEGTGLGLAISRQIAERNGGQLTLQPSDRGARFRLTLPRASP